MWLWKSVSQPRDGAGGWSRKTGKWILLGELDGSFDVLEVFLCPWVTKWSIELSSDYIAFNPPEIDFVSGIRGDSVFNFAL